MKNNRVGIAVLAKAPIAGYAKTRLLPGLSATAAARIHRELTLRTLQTAIAADIGEVSLWCAPNAQHRFFRAIVRSQCFGHRLGLREQAAGDLGQRMAAIFACASGPLLMVGTDCPAMSVTQLRQGAQALQDGNEAVFVPTEDGGYALVGLRRAAAELFVGIDWGSDRVMLQTRQRLQQLHLRWHELETLWDVDRAEDVVRWRETLPA